MLSVVIPTFNELKTGYLPKILKVLSEIKEVEVICADSLSQDGSREIMQQYNVKIVNIETNSRAVRLNAGIEAAKNDLIILNHPRSYLTKEGIEHLIRCKDDISWGGFTHRFDDKHPLLAFTSWYSNYIRGKMKKILYLDHCIFFKKSLLPSPIVPEIDIFEDTALSERLREVGQLTLLPFPSTTSAVRFRHNGVWFQAILNQFLKIGYSLNIPHKKMNAMYEKGLSLNSKYLKK